MSDEQVGRMVPVAELVVEDPLSPDAPIHQLLSIRHNPLVKDMTDEELTAFVQRLRTLATSAPTLSAKLNEDSERVRSKRPASATTIKRKALLAEL